MNFKFYHAVVTHIIAFVFMVTHLRTCVHLCIHRSLIEMRMAGYLWLLLALLVDISVQQCTIDEFQTNLADIVTSTEATEFVQFFTINSTYYNCLSTSQIVGHYRSMSVSILYIRSDDPNNLREVRYNLQCNSNVWGVVGSLSTALRSNNTRFNCSACTDQIVNEYHCTG